MRKLIGLCFAMILAALIGLATSAQALLTNEAHPNSECLNTIVCQSDNPSYCVGFGCRTCSQGGGFNEICTNQY